MLLSNDATEHVLDWLKETYGERGGGQKLVTRNEFSRFLRTATTAATTAAASSASTHHMATRHTQGSGRQMGDGGDALDLFARTEAAAVAAAAGYGNNNSNDNNTGNGNGNGEDEDEDGDAMFNLSIRQTPGLIAQTWVYLKQLTTKRARQYMTDVSNLFVLATAAILLGLIVGRCMCMCACA